MPESSNKGGRKPRVTDEDLLDVFRSTSDPVLSTAEVADAVPIKRRGTLNRLQSLEEDGELESKQIGGRNTVWWTRDDAGQGHGRSREVTDEAADMTGSTAEPANRTATESRPLSGSVDLDAILDGWRPGRSREDREQRREIGRQVLAWLREDGGPATATEFKDALYTDHHLDGQGEDAWWRKTARPALQQAQDAGVVEYSHGRHEYRWVGNTEA